MFPNPPSPHSSNTSGSDSPSPSPTINQVPAVLALQKKKHICHYPNCTRAFTTSGHLARHARVHTGERKHKCPFPGCETRCSRQDNLQQHYRIHLSPGSRRTATRNAARQSRTTTPVAESTYTPPPAQQQQQQQQQHVTQNSALPPPDSPPALVMATVEAYQRRHSYQPPAQPERSGYYSSNDQARPPIPSRQNSYDVYSNQHRDNNYPPRAPLPSTQPASYHAPETNTRSTSYSGGYPSATSYTRDTYTPPKPYGSVNKTSNHGHNIARSTSYGSGPISRLVDAPKEYDSYAASDREAYNGHGGVEPYHSTTYHRPMQYVNA